MNLCQCGIQEASNICEGGLKLFNSLSVIVKSNQHVLFYSLVSSERRKEWEKFNKAANAYLEHINYQIQPSEEQQQNLAAAVLIWKLELVKHEENKYQIEQVIGWIKEGLTSSQLDNRIEDWQMGFNYDCPEWRGYSAALGVVWTDYYKPYQPGWTKEKRILDIARYQASVGVWPAPQLVHYYLRQSFGRYDITELEVRDCLEWDDENGVSNLLQREKEAETGKEKES